MIEGVHDVQHIFGFLHFCLSNDWRLRQFLVFYCGHFYAYYVVSDFLGLFDRYAKGFAKLLSSVTRY